MVNIAIISHTGIMVCIVSGNFVCYNQKGLTLAEILASVFIIFLLTTQLLTVFLICGKWIYNARNEMIAGHLAFSVLESVRTKQDFDMDTWAGDELDIPGELDLDFFIPQGLSTRLIIESAALPHIYQVKVIVDYKDEGRDRSLIMQTFIRRSF